MLVILVYQIVRGRPPPHPLRKHTGLPVSIKVTITTTTHYNAIECAQSNSSSACAQVELGESSNLQKEVMNMTSVQNHRKKHILGVKNPNPHN